MSPVRILSRFAASRRGNVAMMFAIMLVPLLAAGGVALDLLRANSARTAVAEAADAALLAAARAKLRNPSMTDAAALAIAQKNFAANAAGISGVTVSSFSFEHDQNAKTFRITGAGSIDTTLLQVVGRRTVNFGILSEAREAEPRALEIALVLDNTYSMVGQKLSDLKSAANALVNVVMKDTGNTTKVAVVPFSRHVNVGVSRKFEPWLIIEPDGVWNENSCTVDVAAASAQGCSSSPSTCHYDGAPYACDVWSCPSGSAPETCTTIAHPTTWFGCVGSRSTPLHIKDEGYATNPVPGVNNAGGPDCPTELTPLTTNKGTVQAALNQMDVTGETYIGSGLFWGQAVISSDAPFTEGMTYADMTANDAIKAIVLMTDGENTASPEDWGGHYDANVTEANDNTRDLCTDIKSKGVRIYTIAFDVTDASIITLMRNCASDPSYFYDAQNSAQLSAAFDSIGSNLAELALTK